MDERASRGTPADARLVLEPGVVYGADIFLIILFLLFLLFLFVFCSLSDVFSGVLCDHMPLFVLFG